ncbi:hypothetical protein GCM10027456_61530 [Kineosporia babensis]
MATASGKHKQPRTVSGRAADTSTMCTPGARWTTLTHRAELFAGLCDIALMWFRPRGCIAANGTWIRWAAAGAGDSGERENKVLSEALCFRVVVDPPGSNRGGKGLGHQST